MLRWVEHTCLKQYMLQKLGTSHGRSRLQRPDPKLEDNIKIEP